MDKFLSCDWGTTSFRIRLVLCPDLQVLAEETSGEGISSTFNLWKEENLREEKRFDFYLSVLKKRIKSLEQKQQHSLKKIPVVISGMASSSIGMMEMPYKSLPFRLNGSDLVAKKIKRTDNFPHDIFIISGIRTEDDVIRGEETQLLGCSSGDGFFIFPGTHSKHIIVKDGMAVDFKTFMTGEFFDLLTSKSILSSSVNKSKATEQFLNVFDKGVKDGQSNLLHASFLVRTNQLFNKYSKEENFYYLSGLLIGNELRDLNGLINGDIFLIGAKELCSYYDRALQSLMPGKKIAAINADEATIKGQYKIFSIITRSSLKGEKDTRRRVR